MEQSFEVTRIHLAASVPLAIAELQRSGGPSDEDRRWLTSEATEEVFAGPWWMGGKEYKRGDVGRIMAKLTRMLAIAAFVPGGVTVFGEHWEATQHGTD